MLPVLRNRIFPTLAEQELPGPWRELRREMDRLLENAVSGGFIGSAWMPALDVEESQEGLRLTLEVPGVSPEDLHVSLENGVLTVSGEKRFKGESGDAKAGSGAMERRYGRFERSVVLPQAVDFDKVSAHCENGVLTIELPKSEKARPRRIEIGTGEKSRGSLPGKGERSAA